MTENIEIPDNNVVITEHYDVKSLITFEGKNAEHNAYKLRILIRQADLSSPIDSKQRYEQIGCDFILGSNDPQKPTSFIAITYGNSTDLVKLRSFINSAILVD